MVGLVNFDALKQNRAVNGLDMPQASNDPISQAQAEAAGFVTTMGITLDCD